ncbi:MAG: class I SAM-dependent methyltransferase [Candidatus Woesearchaeota archaeon]
MVELPKSEVYERELVYMPYKKSLEAVCDTVCSEAPQKGNVLDLMCGPGYLLNQIQSRRNDLSFRGVDLDPSYIAHAKEKYSGIKFEVGNVLLWNPGELFDVVLCTGSVHHLSYEDQPDFIKKIPSMMKPGGFSIISDCYIDNYANEAERRLAAAKLGYEYLIATIRNGADEEVIVATLDILLNDVMGEEFKTSLKKRMPVFKSVFDGVGNFKTWPGPDCEYGDYFTICRMS